MSKLITVTDEVYEALSKMKGKKSFSEEVKTLIEKEVVRRSNMRLLFGALKDEEDLDQLERQIAKDRKGWYKRRKIEY